MHTGLGLSILSLAVWPIPQNRPNQFCTCLIWSLTGLLSCKPNIGDQGRHLTIQKICPTIQESQRRSYNAAVSIGIRGFSILPTFLFRLHSHNGVYVTPRPPTANGPPTPLTRPVGPIPCDGQCLIFGKLIRLVCWSWNHHMTFPHDLDSLARYRESLPDRSSILPLL